MFIRILTEDQEKGKVSNFLDFSVFWQWLFIILFSNNEYSLKIPKINCQFSFKVKILYSHIQLHVYIYTREHNHIIITTSITNEYTFYKNINLSHFIFEKVMFVVCERLVEDKDGLLYWPRFFLDH